MDQVKDWAIEGAVLPQEETLPTQEEFDVALQGLLNLGYQRSEAMRALKGLDPSLPLSTLMRAALQRLS
ncbi:hypothetical protein [Levyella massiliensis]